MDGSWHNKYERNSESSDYVLGIMLWRLSSAFNDSMLDSCYVYKSHMNQSCKPFGVLILLTLPLVVKGSTYITSHSLHPKMPASILQRRQELITRKLSSGLSSVSFKGW